MTERWLLLAAGSADAATRFAQARGAQPVDVVSRGDLPAAVRRWRRRASATEIDRVVVHSPDWRRQAAPQLYELALAMLSAHPRAIGDGASGRLVEINDGHLLKASARLTRDLGVGLGNLAGEVRRFRRTTPAPPAARPHVAAPSSVLAIWIGEPKNVGGSVSHISGILSGFRDRGLRVGLLTTSPPPAQLAEVIDDVEVAEPLPAGSRLVIEMQRVADNAAIRAAAARLIDRLSPDFVYQRHRPMLVAGTDVAAMAGAPLVLEWNASEQWKRRNWETRGPVDWVFDGLLAQMEEATVRAADLVVAVSDRAGEMALECGAPRDRVMTVPNAVRMPPDDLPAPEPGQAPGSGGVVGWIGTFGPWHGAEVLVSALAELPPEIRLRMIGDGSGRAACRELARELGVDERIEWTGAMPHDEALAALSACDLLASPHVPLADRPFFGSPMKIFEYMALGRPIVASRLEQLGDLLEDGRTARLVSPGDAGELAAAIAEVLASEDRGAALGSAAQDEARREHTWDRRAEQILDALCAA